MPAARKRSEPSRTRAPEASRRSEWRTPEAPASSFRHTSSSAPPGLRERMLWSMSSPSAVLIESLEPSSGAWGQGTGLVTNTATNNGGIVRASGGQLTFSNFSGGNVNGGQLLVDDASTLRLNGAHDGAARSAA